MFVDLFFMLSGFAELTALACGTISMARSASRLWER